MTTEAEYLMAAIHPDLRNNEMRVDQQKAEAKLLLSLAELAKRFGYEVMGDDTQTSIGHPTSGQWAVSAIWARNENRERVLRLSDRDEKTVEVTGIRYDPILREYVGKEKDTFRSPVPGETVRYREALAVVVETLTPMMRSGT